MTATVEIPEPELTPDQVVARAEAIAPTLVERQAETEKRGYYAEDTHEAFRAAGFYRILVPRRYGGYEFGLDTFMRVVQALTRGCPSTGWMYCLGAAHAHAAASIFEERVQDEIFAVGDFICPATVAPGGNAEKLENGDWRLSGTWNYCSGSPYATHFIGHTLVFGEDGTPSPMMFVVPREQWTRLDDWNTTLGLRGSGSHSISMENAHIPAHHMFDMHLSQVDVSGGTAGAELHGNPFYGGGLLSFMVLEDAVLAVGMAQSALDACEELMKTRSTIFPPIQGRAQDPDYQFRFGQATGMIATAEAAFHNAIQQWEKASAEGSAAFTPERELRIALICREVVRLSFDAVQAHLVPTAGSSAVRNGSRVERVWRDLSMQHSHAGISVFLSAIAQREYSQARLGAA
ncbi:acyl-CoA dehydrogenase family protein [Amycolatopsis sp. YIM 10]|uniref:acyl-CoA dehydrogenase family protein n=1 Tax=Amycolatopsis sp. YIM 10 TaxID=2653857 RepID=UPI00128FF266|nr:acyl-CoA dehydrogenase family protein [Amycolatopsis sp. YIM 10]QFU93313.1 Flavin-dependent monooxygenase, oxygenase subunit HsaA [Amycolatopsis sp. YIM 10]